MAPLAVPWELHYDRRVPDHFLRLLLPGGVAASLAQYARHAPYPVDLQLRADAKRPSAHHASLYVGLTTVLDLHGKATGSFALDADKRWRSQFPFDDKWLKAASIAEWRDRWGAVEDYLEQVIPIASKEHAHREGLVQSAASVFASPDRVMFDRESVIAFRDIPMRTSIMQAEKSRLAPAMSGLPKKLGKPTGALGGKCDLLGVDANGSLLAIEVKPSMVPTIKWAPAQVTVYARLLERWLVAPNLPTSPAEVIRGMLRQRHALGLCEELAERVPDQLRVVPVIAVQKGANPAYVDGLRQVQRALVAAGVGYDQLLLCQVNMAGRLDELTL